MSFRPLCEMGRLWPTDAVVKAWLTRTILKSCEEMERGQKIVKRQMDLICKYREGVHFKNTVMFNF